jgi:oxalate decarboxylase/phosphoglucose isomerase-like protein (cupin superfamily)
MGEAFAMRTQEEMKDVLMNPEKSGPSVHYYMVRGGSEKKNITIWESGLVGEEYIKAYGHYHVDDLPETYTLLNGKGILLTQMRNDVEGIPVDDEIVSVKAIFMKAGDTIEIPPRAGHLMINTGNTWLITMDDSPIQEKSQIEAGWPAHANYSPIKKLRGFAYYCVKKDGKPTFIKNETYKTIPDIEIEYAS